MLQFLIHALQYVLDFVHNYMCCILCTNNYAYKKSIICGEFWIGFFFFFWLIGEFWIGGEGIWCKSSRSSWNWESKESFKGIKTPFLLKKKKKILHIFLLHAFAWLVNLYGQMQDHEQALIDAIAKLADISDGESGISQLILYDSL